MKDDAQTLPPMREAEIMEQMIRTSTELKTMRRDAWMCADIAERAVEIARKEAWREMEIDRKEREPGIIVK